MTRKSKCFLLIGLLGAAVGGQGPQIPEVAASAPKATDSAATQEGSGLRFSWVANHPSGIYFAKEEGKISLLIDNPSKEGLPLAGKIVFGRIEGAGFEAVAITPVEGTVVGAGRRVKLEVPVTFGLPGRYGVKVNDALVSGVFDMGLEVRYPPQVEGGGVTWLGAMPAAAGVVEGFLADYAERTGVRRFVVEDGWKGAQAVDMTKVVGEAKKAKVEVVWHLTLPVMENVDAAAARELSAYVGRVMAVGKGVVKGVVVDPWMPGDGRRMEAAEYQTCYAAVYRGVKEADSTVALLGTSWAAATKRLLLDSKGTAYVDGLATSGDAADFLLATKKGDGGLGMPAERVWLLPKTEGASGVPTVVAMGAGLRNIAMAAGDKGIGMHVLGGAVMFGRVRETTPPYVAVLQGNGFAVGAVAGIGAGTPVDGEWAGLGKQAGATLEVHDENKEMRVVDAAGNTLERATGDMYEVPLDGRMWYVLAAGSAQDMAAALRRAETHGMAAAEVTGVRIVAGVGVKMMVRSTALDVHEGVVRVLDGEKELGSVNVEKLEPGKRAEVVVDGQWAGKEVTVEVIVGGERVKVVVGK